MRKLWQIFFRDLKRLVVNPVALIITIGVAIIPSLYAWFNILANWDPYENTSTVPIAVVIEDEGADVSNMGYTNAGDMIREELEQNTQLGWKFVDDEDEAVEGVRAGTYYAAFVVPTDFTSSLADVLDGNTDKAHIAYYVNEKANAVAPKVTDTGSTTIENQIANKFVELAGTKVVNKLQTFMGKTADNVNGARDSVSTNLADASGSLSDLADDLSSNQGALDSARSAIVTAKESLSTVGGSTDDIASSLQASLDSLSGTRTKASSLAGSLQSALSTGSTSLSGISSKVSYSIGQITGEVGWAQGQLDGAISALDALQGNTLADCRTSLERVRLAVDGLDDSVSSKSYLLSGIDSAISKVQSVIDYTQSKVDTLKNTSAALKSTNDTVSELVSNANSAIQNGSSSLNDLQTSLSSTTLPALSSSLDGFASNGAQLAGVIKSISPMLSQASSSLDQLDGLIEGAGTTLTSAADSVRSVSEKVGSISSDVAAVESVESYAAVSRILGLDSESVGSFLGSPAELVDQSVYAVKNYGSGVAPFYTNLALWVGGFVLVAIFKLESDDEGIGDFKPWQGFFGRWLLLNIIGQVQAIICCVGDIVLGIQCLSPVAFVFAGMVQSFVYVFFIYSLSIAFKHIGKALCVLLVVLQIPGASGTYPIEMQPVFFQALNPWLPFTYGINAMREAIAGFYGNYYAMNLLTLLLFLVPALLIGVAARRHLLNINTLFDRKLGETDMMITERTGLETHFRLTTIVKALMDSQSYKETFIASAASFELKYPVLVRRGFVALIVVPLVLLALMFATEAKFAMLILWIISLVAICTFLIVVEYLHDRVESKTSLADKTPEELYDMLDDELKGELLAFAPIEKMRIERGAAAKLAGVIADSDVTTTLPTISASHADESNKTRVRRAAHFKDSKGGNQ
ncbi:YhgE/Pip domain-containing protein [Paratractidigestivibacter sp.]|uniref:YhgE/Pip domain-containing protein n=1 Tax=Paratractidigestivibacter sp. TaxID=2847316 RepID=UPI002AC90AC2|nr:YhgE/Pip domain-containing protein [Paratractidigestivibacter sp.]